MLEVGYSKTIPFPFDIVLSQYFDYEHIAHVHPKTLGEYRLVEVSEDRIVYDQIWAVGWNGRQKVSRVEQRFTPPNEIDFLFLSGLHRGVKVHTLLTDRGKETHVEETYSLPLPNWAWLKPLVRPFMMQSIERIWKEDIDVGVCYGGWPGLEAQTSLSTTFPSPAKPLQGQHVLGTPLDFPENSLRMLTVEGNDILIISRGGQYWAVENHCTHAGAPLSLGRVAGDCVICPWHGAQFEVATGRVLCGSAQRSLQTYHVWVEEGTLLISSVPVAKGGNGERS